MTAPTARIAREKKFWNQHSSRERYANWRQKDYATWAAGQPRRGALAFLGPVLGRRILCCGVGPEAVVFAGAGAEVWGFDISEEQVGTIQALADKWGLTVHLDVMPFEEMTYRSAMFDLAYGSAILHHVDLALGANELARVLKPSGRAAFIEPLAENPLLNYARARLPYPRKSRTEDESPMTYRDIAVFGRPFGRCEYHEISLLGMWRKILPSIAPALDRMDGALLALPPLRRLCAQAWIGVEAPPYSPDLR